MNKIKTPKINLDPALNSTVWKKDEPLVGFWDEGTPHELQGLYHFKQMYIDKFKFINAIGKEKLSFGALLITPKSVNVMEGKLEAIYIGLRASHWVCWRRQNESLEKFINRANDMSERFDELSNR
jgi:hypothetical protein